MITNGLVSIEDGTKATEEFGVNRKVRVELSFTVDEGADEKATLHDAGVLANDRVRELLGKKAVGNVAAQVTTAAPASTTVAPTADKPKRTTAKKDAPLPPAGSFSDPLEGALEGAAKGPAASSETLIPENVPAATVPQAVDLSDKALYDKVMAINAKVKKPQEIVAIVAKYCPQDGVPASLKRVPEASRQACLNEIEEFAKQVEAEKALAGK